MTLLLPPTIRTPELIDIPQDESTLDMMERRRNANIIEGYNITNQFDSTQLYSFYSEINIDNNKLWHLIKALIVDFPDNVALIYHYIDDEEPKYGRYVDKFELLVFLADYETELVQDGFFHFGIINNTETELQEIFVHRTKYIQYWGMDEKRFKVIMDNFDLYKIEHLNFIDEYPVQSTVLSAINADVTDTLDLLKIFKSRYGDQQLT